MAHITWFRGLVLICEPVDMSGIGTIQFVNFWSSQRVMSTQLRIHFLSCNWRPCWPINALTMPRSRRWAHTVLGEWLESRAQAEPESMSHGPRPTRSRPSWAPVFVPAGCRCHVLGDFFRSRNPTIGPTSVAHNVDPESRRANKPNPECIQSLLFFSSHQHLFRLVLEPFSFLPAPRCL